MDGQSRPQKLWSIARASFGGVEPPLTGRQLTTVSCHWPIVLHVAVRSAKIGPYLLKLLQK